MRYFNTGSIAIYKLQDSNKEETMFSTIDAPKNPASLEIELIFEFCDRKVEAQICSKHYQETKCGFDIDHCVLGHSHVR